MLTVEADGRLIHVTAATELKRDIEASIGEFVLRNETARLSGEAEIGDLSRAFTKFRQLQVN